MVKFIKSCLFAAVMVLPCVSRAQTPALKPPRWNILPRSFDEKTGDAVESDFKSQQCPIGYVNIYLSQMAARLDQVAHYHTPHKVRLLSTGNPLVAFTIPNGTIFVSAGLLRLVSTESELAAVMGHEVGHSVYRTFTSGEVVWFSTYGLVTVLQKIFEISGPGFFTSPNFVSASIAGAVHGYRDEARCDDFGMYAATRAGYNPYGMYRAFSAMDNWMKQHFSRKGFDLSHPPMELRIQNALQFAKKLDPVPKIKYRNSWQFEKTKHLLSLCRSSK